MHRGSGEPAQNGGGGVWSLDPLIDLQHGGVTARARGSIPQGAALDHPPDRVYHYSPSTSFRTCDME